MDANEALSSKITGIVSDSQNIAGEAVRRIKTATAARGQYGSSYRIDETWKAIQLHGREAAFKMIDACLSVGMRVPEEIDTKVVPEYECYLRSWNEGAGGLEQREEMLRANARTFVSRIQTEVRSRVFDAEKQDASDVALSGESTRHTADTPRVMLSSMSSTSPSFRGKTLGKWKIDRLVGGGGQATVWVVRPLRSTPAPPRAMKICTTNDTYARTRFEREVALLEAHCEHVPVVKVFDKDLTWSTGSAAEGLAYYVMELALGTIDDARWVDDTIKVLGLFREACVAVDILNGRGAFHRDLKPDNLLVFAEAPRVRLADFGIAAEADGQRHLTRAQEVVGTVDYRAPEVVRHEPATARSEVFSLGRVLQRLLCGRVDSYSVLSPRKLTARAADAFEAIIRRSTDIDPNRRYAGAAELGRVLPDLRLDLEAALAASRPSSLASPSDADVRGLVPIAPGVEGGEFGNEFARRRHPNATIIWKPASPAFCMLHVTPQERRDLNPLEAGRLLDQSTSLLPLGSSARSHASAAWPQMRAMIDSVALPEGGLEAQSLTGITCGARGAAIVGLDGNIAWREDEMTMLDLTALRGRLTRGVDQVARFLNELSPDWFPVVVTIAVVGAKDSRIQLERRSLSTRNGDDVIAHRFIADRSEDIAWEQGLQVFVSRVAAAHGEEA